MRAVLVIAIAGLLAPSQACLNDSDTLRQGMQKFPTVVEAIVGRFEKNPPLYYEMRIERLTSVLASNPSNLQAYDDIAVAYDRLGKDKISIDWMAKKWSQLEKMGGRAPKYHLYSYHANLGTFQIHSFIQEGALKSNSALAHEARNNIAKAIEIEPQAHFNREPVQLAAIDWIVSMVDSNRPTPLQIGRIEPLKPREVVEGLAGLIVLAAAWESVDILKALSDSWILHVKSGSTYHLAELRYQELLRSGKKSLQERFGGKTPPATPVDNLKVYQEFDQYQALRKNAEQYRLYRETFMLAKLKEGRHPDTDVDFWNGYREVPRYEPSWSVWDILPGSLRFTWPYVALPAASILLLIGVYIHGVRERRRLPLS